MPQGKKEQAAALAVGCGSLILCLVGVPPEHFAMYAGCPWQNRLLWHFFHANIFHCILNVWVLLQFAFMTPCSLWRMLWCYAFACTAWSQQPVVGLSGVLMALMGSYTFQVRRRLYWISYCAAFIALGFFIGRVAAWVHLWCFMGGLVYSVLNIRVADD